MDLSLTIIAFEWDEANQTKNWTKHEVSWQECEDVFFNEPLFIQPDIRHSLKEDRYHALGHTNRHRLLYVSFTIRKERIRIVSAREMSHKERKIYDAQKKADSKVQI